MEEKCKNNTLFDWEKLIFKLSKKGQSVGIGIFDLEGNLLDANSTMCYFLDTDLHELHPRNDFVNPVFSTFISNNQAEIVFEGLLTIGNSKDVSYVLSSKVFRRDDKIMVYAEADVVELFEKNKKMSILNQEINNLQRQLIKEKMNLKNSLSELSARTTEFENLNVRLSELNVEKNRYIGMVAHDLRNPIGIAESFSDILITDFDTISKEDKLEYLGFIKSNCSFSLNLIHDFLDSSKIEAGIFDLNLEELEYIGFVKESIVQSQIMAKNKLQEIIISTDLSTIIASFDRNKIQQVLNNLSSNAVKYSFSNTKIVIKITETSNKIITKVIDQGQGIPEEELSKLFNPFQTTSVKTTANEKATGLGLAIVKKIIEAHHGTVKVESTVGKGTTFSFSLPKQINAIETN